MANYFDTDGMHDYFAQFDKEHSPKTVTMTDSLGNVVFKSVQTWVLRKYYKDHYCKPPENGKRIWRERLTALGFIITKG